MSSKDPVHLILKSSKARGAFSLNGRNTKMVNELVRKQCGKFGVKQIQYSNNFNHLHLLAKFPSRAIYLRFIRSLTASIAMAQASFRNAKVGSKTSRKLNGDDISFELRYSSRVHGVI